MPEKNPAVSVIIPVYNAEKYIGDCLTSLANQTFADFEVIVVDDCSSDNSRAVVENFFATFGDRLKFAKLSANSGFPGIPRNVALEAARGDYVYFLDADDLLTANALEELFVVAEKFQADVVHAEKCLAFFDADGVEGAEAVSFQEGEFVTEPTLETFDIAARIDAFTQKKFLWWAWNKLFRRRFLRENKITFPAMRCFEDFVFVLKCIVAAKNYVRVPSVNYYYRVRDDSISHRSDGLAKFFDNVLAVVKSMDDFMAGEKFFADNPNYRYALTDFFVRERLGNFAEKTFLQSGYDAGEVFEFFRDEIFSRKPEDNVAFTAYLFVAMNILKLKADS